MAIRNIILHFAAVLSAITQAALCGIIITIAVAEVPINRLRPFVLASSTLNGIVTLALLAIVAKVLSDSRSTSLEHFLFSLSFTISTTALVLSFYVLITVWTILDLKVSSLQTSFIACLAVTGLALCSFTLITQFTTHLLLLLPRQHHNTADPSPVPSPKRFPGTSRPFTTPTSPSRTQLTPYSPSINSLHSLKSSRQGSINQVFAPIGPKTRLLITHSLYPADSQIQLSGRAPSLEIACRGDVTHRIDVSEPFELSSSPPMRMNLTRTMLETIPGSRPVSPAKPLQPYLWDEITPEDFPLPDSPSLSRATSPVHASSVSPAIEYHIHGLPFPPMIGEFATSSQTHIHPLFRSGSPGPPPAVVTPGTKVIASPYAGQVVASDHALLRRKKSSTRSPTPVRSPAPSLERLEIVPNFSRPGTLSRSGSQSADMF